MYRPARLLWHIVHLAYIAGFLLRVFCFFLYFCICMIYQCVGNKDWYINRCNIVPTLLMMSSLCSTYAATPSPVCLFKHVSCIHDSHAESQLRLKWCKVTYISTTSLYSWLHRLHWLWNFESCSTASTKRKLSLLIFDSTEHCRGHYDDYVSKYANKWLSLILAALECTECVFGRGSTSIGPHWGSLQRSPSPLAVLRGLLQRGGEGREVGKGMGRERKDEGNKQEGPPLMQIPGSAPASISA